MSTFYLHVGTPKTGTTAIQNFMKENQAVLEKHDYAYPLFYEYGMTGDEAGIARNAHPLIFGEYLKLGKYEEAIDYLKKFNGKDEILAPMALGAIGDCYMELDDMNSAVSYYEKAANKAKNEFTGPMFLTKAAMTHEIMGNYAAALKCYKTLKADYPLSNEAFEVGKNIANMEEKLK